MPVDAAFEQLRRANPEPDPAALRRHLQDLKSTPPMAARSNTMDTRTPTIQTRPPTQPRRRWLPALVAGLIVILLGIPVLIVQNGGTVFGLFKPSPVEVAERYIAARNAYDAETARRLLADNVDLLELDLHGATVDELDLYFEMLRTFDQQLLNAECLESGVAEPVLVTCSYDLDTALQHAIGYPTMRSRFIFYIADGLIVRGTSNFPVGEFTPNVGQPWIDWLNAEHPGAYDQIYTNYDTGTPSGIYFAPKLTPEAFALTSQYIAEWDQSLNG